MMRPTVHRAAAEARGDSLASLGTPALYILGAPGKIGGAATKIAHLVRLLQGEFTITIVLLHPWMCKDKEVRRLTEPYGVRLAAERDLPRKLEGVLLAICEPTFFSSGKAQNLKERGLKLVWSNEMMWAFPGEAEAAKQGLTDRVLFVSDSQASMFQEMYCGVQAFNVGNYIDPDDYAWRERENQVFTLGRLSRPDPDKYPMDFPAFYEEIGLRQVRYRVMAWSPELDRRYRWHHFGPEWELLRANKEPALTFLYSLDLFVYTLGHCLKESWGRSVVEAMLTGCVPVVPIGHEFHKFIVHGETGFVCERFSEFRDSVVELFENYPLRVRMAKRASDYAREYLCNREEHRRRWVAALSF